ncbi:peptide ABC transporter permease [Desulfoluna limicola]|uniref:Peptide ABC transporter permease n=1 Tax=Desulfoluna limicola TaxID=2810562 RepID=A0ABM7PKV7_9BACT|nr:ABC transporter permease [Desulfoluna limicola]BCS98048.1 peptide ABC transporter permease [Desulfoluna limicola]
MQTKKNSLWGQVFARLKKNRMAMMGLCILLGLLLTALLADVIAPFPFDEQDLFATLEGPSKTHWFGTDEFGRDILSRIIHGSRISLQVGFVAVGFSVVAGGFIGAVAGYYGGRTDNILMRLMDILLSIPQLLLAISVAASLGPGLLNLMLAVGIAAIPQYARLVRASVLSIRDQEYVEAAVSVGSSDLRIIFRHILPNCMAPIIVQATLGVAFAILIAAGLSFIGLGLEPPTPEWGAMLSGGREFIRDYPYMTIFPGLAIMITILGLNFLGDGLRDALDPKLRN